MQTDYYSEQLKSSVNEDEIFESLPEVSYQKPKIEQSIEITSDDLVIEEDNTSKLRSINSGFEKQIRDHILYSTRKENDRSNKALRFKLLENEMRALILEIGEDSDDNTTQLKEQIDRLENDVNEFKNKNQSEIFLNYWNSRINDITTSITVDQHLTNDNSLLSNKSLDLDHTQTLEVENRIAKLEQKLSLSEDIDLTSLVEDLKTKTNLILDGGDSILTAQQEIRVLQKNCETFIQDSKRIKDKTEIIPLTDGKLLALYDRLKKLPDIEVMLTKIMERLQTLNQIVIETAQNADFISGLNNELSHIENKIDNWSNKMNDMEAQLKIDESSFNEFISRSI